MRRTAAAALIPLVLAIPACARPVLGSPETASSASPAVQEGSLPPGWRWESYGGVEVGIPGGWGWDSGPQRLNQWCILTKDRIAKPIVGRPAGSTAVACLSGKPGPETLIANTGSVVTFDRTTEKPGVRQQGDQTVVTWAMYGKANFISKAMGLFMDCDKMCGDMFNLGLTKLKTLVEKPA